MLVNYFHDVHPKVPKNCISPYLLSYMRMRALGHRQGRVMCAYHVPVRAEREKT